MPTLDRVLGFSNRWYPLAIRSAESVMLPSTTQIRVISAPAFLATKLEAFSHRGNDDYLFSHDLGDLIAVIDGRETLIAECKLDDAALRTFLREWMSRLLDSHRFMEALPGHLPTDAGSQARMPELIEKLRILAGLT
jgi:hypothetical protein